MDCIVGFKNHRKYYLTTNGSFITDKEQAQTFENHNEAIRTWMSITNCGTIAPNGMERIFVPIYSED